MIRSKKIEKIDDLRRKVGVVYLEVMNRQEDDLNKTISFDVVFRTPKKIVQEMPAQRTITREDGSEFVESFIGEFERTVLVEYRREKATYRTEKFYENMCSVTPEQYDQILISEIDRLNKLTPTGNEIQTDFFFYEWTKDDLEIVSEEELQEMANLKLVQ